MEKFNNEKALCYDMRTLQSVLPLGKNKLYEVVHSQGFPKIKVGRRILIPRAALETWLVEKASLGEFV